VINARVTVRVRKARVGGAVASACLRAPGAGRLRGWGPRVAGERSPSTS